MFDETLFNSLSLFLLSHGRGWHFTFVGEFLELEGIFMHSLDALILQHIHIFPSVTFPMHCSWVNWKGNMTGLSRFLGSNWMEYDSVLIILTSKQIVGEFHEVGDGNSSTVLLKSSWMIGFLTHQMQNGLYSLLYSLNRNKLLYTSAFLSKSEGK